MDVMGRRGQVREMHKAESSRPVTLPGLHGTVLVTPAGREATKALLRRRASQLKGRGATVANWGSLRGGGGGEEMGVKATALPVDLFSNLKDVEKN